MRRSAARRGAMAALASAVLLAGAPAMVLTACGRERVDVVGSDTMVHLAQRWVEAYAGARSRVAMSVSGGGSGTGLAALINGYADVALSSRPASAAETGAAARRGRMLEGRVVGYDGLAVIVHPDNPVRTVTVAQLADLFAGHSTNWRTLGGVDGPVLLVSREVNSGTHVYFRAHVLRGAEFATEALKMPSSRQVHDTVARIPGAVGYVGLAFVTPAVRVLAVAAQPGAPAVLPVPAAVRDGQYAISRPLWLYFAAPASPAVAEFIAWTLDPAGQGRVAQAGFVPVLAP